jgi:hypothetical protein
LRVVCQPSREPGGLRLAEHGHGIGDLLAVVDRPIGSGVPDLDAVQSPHELQRLLIAGSGGTDLDDRVSPGIQAVEPGGQRWLRARGRKG